MRNFKTHNQEPNINISATSRLEYLVASREELVAVYGQPADDIDFVEWNFEWQDEDDAYHQATIYRNRDEGGFDWKIGAHRTVDAWDIKDHFLRLVKKAA